MCRQARYCNGDSDIKAVILHAGLGAIGSGSQMSNLQVFIADTLGSWRSHETWTSHDKHKWKNMMNRLCSLMSTRRRQTPKTSPSPWAFYPVVAAVLLWNLLNVPLWVKKWGKDLIRVNDLAKLVMQETGQTVLWRTQREGLFLDERCLMWLSQQ